ncbi:MAG: neutral/alkaline non-lysosomal ceramidase N-terminal domain-containing protein [Planctomycetes bacterium]|nr:neutral/alkaline non-lysosomal ceramidase N-terminal domain-containing protein [Planctomycetota bacterium]
MRAAGPILGALAIAFAPAAAPIPGAHALEVGVATIDITPPTGLPMSGYASRTEPSHGIWDPLLAKAMVLDDGERRAAIVALDLIGPPPRERRDRIRDAARIRHGIDPIILAATHTHAGPIVRPGRSPEVDAWLTTLEEKILRAVAEALEARAPATVWIGKGEADISYDRRVVRADGAVTMLWRNEERKPNVPVDRTIGVVAFRGAGGEPIATLVHFACHPVIFGGKNRKYSAEFPGAMRRRVEGRIGGACVFLQGACGNINPYLAGETEETGHPALETEGARVGDEVVRIATALREVPSASLRIAHDRPETVLAYRYDYRDEKVRAGVEEVYGKETAKRIVADLPREIRAATPILALGREIAWVGFPGEFFDAFQTDLARRSPIPNTHFVGYADDSFAYFPTIRAAAEGGYGASSATYVEVGAGERLVDRAVIALYRMVGMLRPYPTR